MEEDHEEDTRLQEGRLVSPRGPLRVLTVEAGTMAAAKQPVVTRDQIKDIVHPSLLSLSLSSSFRISFQRCHFLSTSFFYLAEDIVKTCLETGTTLDALHSVSLIYRSSKSGDERFCNLSTFDQFEEEIRGYF